MFFGSCLGLSFVAVYFTVQGYSRETKTVDVKAVEEKNNKAHALKLKGTIKWCESADSDTI